MKNVLTFVVNAATRFPFVVAKTAVNSEDSFVNSFFNHCGLILLCVQRVIPVRLTSGWPV